MDRGSILIGFLIVGAGITAIEIGFPSAILEIAVGFIGANLLGLETTSWLDFIALWGLVGLMFLAGFEIDVDILRDTLKHSFLIGSASYFAPFLLIFSLTYFYFGYDLITSTILALSLSTTSVALVYASLRELNNNNRKMYEFVLGGAMVADVLSMGTLALLIAKLSPTLIFYLALAIILLIISPHLFRLIQRKYGGHPTELETKLILMIWLLLPFLAEKIYLSEAVFAFILGILFSRILEDRAELEKKLKTIVFGLLAPAFFFKAGLLMKSKYFSFGSLQLFLIFVTLAYLGKYLSVYLMSKYLTKDKNLSKLCGNLYNFRLTFGIIAALFGLESGYITQELYGIVLAVILSTSIFTSVVIKKIPMAEA